MMISNYHTELLASVKEKEHMDKVGKIAQKNFLVLCFCYFLLYSGFWALTNLQSTMNADSGIGVSSQAVIYAFAMASSLLLPQLSITKYGCKKVLIVGTVACCGYIASNVYLRFETMMVASAVFGLATGPFISSQSFYVNEMAARFHSVGGGKLENTMACFFGCYAFSLCISQVAGNLISYLVLGMGKATSNSQNISANSSCGIHFDPDSLTNATNSQIVPPTNEIRLILIGIFTLMGLFAALVMVFFLDPLKNDTKESGCQVMGQQLVAALRHLKKSDQLLLIPMSVVLGLECSFYSNEFTAVSLKTLVVYI